MGNLVFQATLGGQVNLVGPNTASTFNLNVPAVSSTLATLTGTETFTNKTLTAPTLASANITTALTLTGAAGTAGQALTSQGSGAAPTWTTVSASQWTTSGSNIYYNSGNVSVGTTSSLGRFGVQTSGNAQWVLDGTGSNPVLFGSSGGSAENTIYEAYSHRFKIGSSTINTGSERGRFNHNGFFQATNNDYPDGAGDANFHYFNSNLSNNPVLDLRADNTSYTDNVLFIRGNRNTTNSSFNLIDAENGNSTGIFRVRDSGNCVNTNNSYGAVSDVSLKENIVDATPKLANLMQVKIRNYNLKTKPDEKQIGVVAQELETIFPSMVEEDKDGVKSVKYSVFVPMLIKAMQEQQELITAQAETITALTARTVALEAK